MAQPQESYPATSLLAKTATKTHPGARGEDIDLSLERDVYVKVLEEHAILEILMWFSGACCLGDLTPSNQGQSKTFGDAEH